MDVKQSCKRVLITGGAGFIGSHLADLLLEEGHSVTVVDNLCNGKMSNLENAEKYPQFHLVQADIRHSVELKGIFSDIDWVFHLAALPGVVPSLERPRDYFETNVDGTYNVLEASHQAGVKRFLYAASASCYGKAEQSPISETAPINPQSPYALTKHLGEQLVLHWAKVYKLPALSLRLFNVFGPRLCQVGVNTAVFGAFLAQKMRAEPLTIVGDGNQTRDFTYVTDVAEAFYAAARSSLTNDILNVGSSSSYSINQLALLLGGPVNYVPKRPGESEYSAANVEKIYKKLSWKARVPFEEGVELLLEKMEESEILL
jgi:UDP-glucose 4-epimerase